MSKHTPGPWFNHAPDGLLDGRTNGASIQDSKGRVICAGETLDPDGDEETLDRRWADAQLIAAAPELLNALELILADDRLMNAMSRIQARAILDAIKNATGGAK